MVHQSRLNDFYEYRNDLCNNRVFYIEILVKNVCCAILKSGKNAGSQCKKPLSKTSSKYCKRHEMVYKKINI